MEGRRRGTALAPKPSRADTSLRSRTGFNLNPVQGNVLSFELERALPEHRSFVVKYISTAASVAVVWCDRHFSAAGVHKTAPPLREHRRCLRNCFFPRVGRSAIPPTRQGSSSPTPTNHKVVAFDLPSPPRGRLPAFIRSPGTGAGGFSGDGGLATAASWTVRVGCVRPTNSRHFNVSVLRRTGLPTFTLEGQRDHYRAGNVGGSETDWEGFGISATNERELPGRTSESRLERGRTVLIGVATGFRRSSLTTPYRLNQHTSLTNSQRHRSLINPMPKPSLISGVRTRLECIRLTK